MSGTSAPPDPANPQNPTNEILPLAPMSGESSAQQSEIPPNEILDPAVLQQRQADSPPPTCGEVDPA
jgi:hypothetical protein